MIFVSDAKFGEWIPVEKGLPKQGEKVLATIQRNNRIRLGIATLLEHGGTSAQWYDQIGIDPRVSGTVLAWMPLPDIYIPNETR